GALAHAGQGGQRRVRAVEDQVLVDLVGDGEEIVAAAQLGHLIERVGGEHLAGRVVRRVEEDEAGACGDGGGQVVGIEVPVGRVQPDQPGNGAGHGGAGGIGVVGGLEHDDLVARLAQGQHGGGDGLGGADGDQHLVFGRVGEAVPALLVLGHGAPQLGDARAGRVLVVAGADGGHGDLTQLVGAVGVREALAEVDRAGGGGQFRHGGEDGGGEGTEACGPVVGGAVGHRTMVLTGGTVAYRRAGPCSPSPTSTCTPGSTGGAGPSTTSPPAARSR